jgi:uncharacterized protein
VTEAVVAGETLHLLPERAVFWPRAGTLIIADLHLGKDETFRAAAIPIPLGPIRADLARLDAALRRSGVERLLILGDLWHARAGMAESLFDELRAWRAARSTLAIELVRGNHDRRAGDPPADLRVACREEPVAEPPFLFRHFPEPSADGYVLAGHVHPAVVLRGEGRQRARLPCFWLGRGVGLLPAFGGFTGSGEVRPRPGDRVFVVAGDEVIAVAPT